MNTQFGDIFPLSRSLSGWGKIGFKYYGYPFIGSYVRSLYFQQALQGLVAPRVLDAGCGSGEYAFFLAQTRPEMQIDAWDSDCEESLEQVKAALGITNVAFARKDLHDLAAADAYDFIYSVDVLEHIADNRTVLAKFFTALRPGGTLFIHLPQKNWHAVHIFNPAAFKIHTAFEAHEHLGQEWILEELAATLEQIGFHIVWARKSFGFWGKLAWELDQLMQEWKWGKRRALCLPLLRWLGSWDVRRRNAEGSGIAILARKPEERSRPGVLLRDSL